MNVPDGVIEGTITLGVMFIFKVVFGLIDKNEKKSDQADAELEKQLEGFRSELVEAIKISRGNDRELYKDTSLIREKLAYEKGLRHGAAKAKR